MVVPMSFRRFWLFGLIGVVGVIWALGGCGSETSKPKPTPPGAQPSDIKPASPDASPGPSLDQPPSVPSPQEKPKPQEEPKPEEKAPTTSPPAEKEKPAEPPAQPTPAKPTPSADSEQKPPASGNLSPTAPVSSYAPAEDLEAQMDRYLQDLQEAVANEEAFKDAEGRLSEDANTLIVLALALGLHDQPNKYQKAAPALMAAAKELDSAKDFPSAKKAVEALVAAANSQGDPSSLKWEKVASMSELMKAVPLISNKIRDTFLTASRLQKRGKDYAGYAALLAVLAQGALPNADETEKPTEVEKWQQFCLQMRAAAGELNAAIRANNPEAAKKANAKLRQTCDDCHAVFHTQP